MIAHIHVNNRVNSLFTLFICLTCQAIVPKAVSAEPAPLVISCHPDYPPVMFVKGQQPMGIAIDVATEILGHLEVPFELVSSGPWNRVQQSARLGKIDMIAGIYHNSERAEYLNYSLPFMEDPTVIFVWRGKEFPFNSLEDLIGKNGTSNLGESFGSKVDSFLEKNVKMQRVVKNEMNFRLLELGRADFFIFGLYPGRIQALQYGYNDKVKPLMKPAITENYYLALSKKSPYSNLIPKINEYIKKNITPKKIRKLNEENVRKYIGRQ